MSLEGRTAVVTGGGRGIGAAAARALAEAGAAVVVGARTAGEIEAVADAIRAGGGRATAVPCDVSDAGAVAALAGEAAELGSVDILVHAAGIATSAPIQRLELADWRRVLEVNATGAFLCTRAFLPGMAERGWGRVVYVASIAGLTGAPYTAAYAASKHAVLGLARCAAAEVAGRGVTVNALCPGYVNTDMTRASAARIAAATGRSPEEALEMLRSRNPQGRLIEPEEVADAAVWLCGDGARGVNGQALAIDGGELLA